MAHSQQGFAVILQVIFIFLGKLRSTVQEYENPLTCTLISLVQHSESHWIPCTWHKSETSALRQFRLEKSEKVRNLTVLVSTHIFTEADEQLTLSMQLDKIIYQGSDIVCTQAGLGPISFLIAGVHHNPENERKL